MSGIVVIKRDGSIQDFNKKKIADAIQKAFEAVGQKIEYAQLDVFAITVGASLEQSYEDKVNPENTTQIPIEAIQDEVEQVLMESEFPDVAKAYILYRNERHKERSKESLRPDSSMISEYIHLAKYARWIPEENRRETFEESVDRTINMFSEKLTERITDPFTLEKNLNILKEAKQFILQKRILPSMRCLQFAGNRIKQHNAALYNCSFSLADRPRFFAEALYLLLCGCGVGYSVQSHHIEKLPVIKGFDTTRVTHHIIEDTIIGWANAVDRLIDAAINGYYPEFSFHMLRPEGSWLHVSGGKSPGHLPLKRLLQKLETILNHATGRQLKSIEVHDMTCHIAEAVLAGGIRRSSLIALFSIDDDDMTNCKIPENFRYAFGNDPGLNPQRAMANNSGVLQRSKCSKNDFVKLFESARHYGDPGFIFSNGEDYGCNPCGEIGLNPKIHRFENEDETMYYGALDTEFITRNGWKRVKDWSNHITEMTGWSFCNLCEVNIAKCDDITKFFRACELASFIGTIQASFTSFEYLGEVTEAICKREALIGVGLTGIMDNPEIGMNAQNLEIGARFVVEFNKATAKDLGINPAARCTTVKPSGTASLLLGCVGSGRHRHHARRYIRRITANKLEAIAQEFRRVNPHMVQEKPNGDLSLMFPVLAPMGAYVEKEATALQSLNETIFLYENWILPGTAIPESSPGLTHNVSSTVSVSENEWDGLISAIWDSKNNLASLSVMPRMGDKGIPFIPREEIIDGDPVDEAIWEKLITNYKPVDYKRVKEFEDLTNRKGEVACSGGVCEIVDANKINTADGTILIFDGAEDGIGRGVKFPYDRFKTLELHNRFIYYHGQTMQVLSADSNLRCMVVKPLRGSKKSDAQQNFRSIYSILNNISDLFDDLTEKNVDVPIREPYPIDSNPKLDRLT
jgi:ribonucleoside-diphosphate reductase alpha chain